MQHASIQWPLSPAPAPVATWVTEPSAVRTMSALQACTIVIPMLLAATLSLPSLAHAITDTMVTASRAPTSTSAPPTRTTVLPKQLALTQPPLSHAHATAALKGAGSLAPMWKSARLAPITARQTLHAQTPWRRSRVRAMSGILAMAFSAAT